MSHSLSLAQSCLEISCFFAFLFFLPFSLYCRSLFLLLVAHLPMISTSWKKKLLILTMVDTKYNHPLLSVPWPQCPPNSLLWKEILSPQITVLQPYLFMSLCVLKICKTLNVGTMNISHFGLVSFVHVLPLAYRTKVCTQIFVEWMNLGISV